MLGGIIGGALLFLSYLLQVIIDRKQRKRLQELVEQREKLRAELAERHRNEAKLRMSVDAMRAMLRGQRVVVTKPPDGETIAVAQAEVDGIGQQLRAAVTGNKNSKS